MKSTKQLQSAGAVVRTVIGRGLSSKNEATKKDDRWAAFLKVNGGEPIKSGPPSSK